MIEADSVHSTPRRFTPKIVAGTDLSQAYEATAPEQPKPIFIRRERPLPEPLTESCRNHRLRLSRREVWSAARRLTEYWRARLDWQTALSIAQEYNVADSHKFPPTDGADRFAAVDLWRTAPVKQMLTPAPDVAAVNWKRAQLRAENYRYTDAKPERLQRAIDADVEWLEAHPSRKSVAASRQAAMARRREFKEAMRQRIRDVAASRDLSDKEIKPALTLKHHEIDRFVEKHGVNFEWLLEGKGRIFKKDPITLNPNMSGSEFAAVVRTLPLDDQRVIEAKVREILSERVDEAPPPIA